MGIFDSDNYEEIDGNKRFDCVTDEGERVKQLIARRPNIFLHINFNGF